MVSFTARAAASGFQFGRAPRLVVCGFFPFPFPLSFVLPFHPPFAVPFVTVFVWLPLACLAFLFSRSSCISGRAVRLPVSIGRGYSAALLL